MIQSEKPSLFFSFFRLYIKQRGFATWAVLAHAWQPSAVEYRPADIVSQPLIVQNKIANGIWQLVALPAALEAAAALALAFRRSRARSPDRVGCGAEFMRGNVRDRRRLTGSICGIARRSALVFGRHCVTSRGAGLGHRGLAARPCPGLLDCVTRPRVRRLRRLKEVQDVLRTRSRPQGEQVMVRIRECATAADGDEARVANFGEDHAAPFLNVEVHLTFIDMVSENVAERSHFFGGCIMVVVL
jgi:hypothetical protein